MYSVLEGEAERSAVACWGFDALGQRISQDRNSPANRDVLSDCTSQKRQSKCYELFYDEYKEGKLIVRNM